MGIASSLKSIECVTDPQRSYWSVTLFTGKEVREQGLVFDFRAGGLRPIDWSLDIVSTGDIYKIQQISLLCPDGQVASLDIEEVGTVFQLKIATFNELLGSQLSAHVIGKVTNKEDGACFCKIWDQQIGLLYFSSSVYRFGSWRAGILPLGRLSPDVLGLRL